MSIFTHQGSLDASGSQQVIRPDGSNVDEQSGRGIYPSSIDYIQLVAGGSNTVVRVDLQEIGAATIDIR